LGVQIVEGTRVLNVGANAIETDRGAVRFQTLIRATEAYTQTMKGHKDLVLPVVSAMVATEPLSNHALDSIGLSDRATFCDGRRVTVYGQRTNDNRIAFGARARYLGSQSIPAQFPWTDPIFSEVEQALFSLLPQLQNQEISHRWGGVLGISPRWHLEVAFDERTQKGHLGGYVGEGVGASNFAARCLVEKMLTRTSEWSDAPFVVERAKRWVPEPIRSVGVAIARGAAERADRTEASGRSSRFWGPLFDALT
jgi:glycine/D-amino acid oxidase-like deaminating enzyme